MSHDICKVRVRDARSCREPGWSSQPSPSRACTQAEAARTYGLSEATVSRLMARYRAEGEAAFEPRSRVPRPHQPRPHRDRGTGPAAAQATHPGRPRRRPRHHRLAPEPTTTRSRVSRATIHRILTRHGAGHPRAEEETEVLLHPLRSRHAQPDLAVRLHPLPTHRHRPVRQGTSRSSPGSTTAPATPCTSQRHRAITTAIVKTTFRESRRSARHPRLHPDRQRHGLHSPTGRPRTPRRTQRLRATTP